jgi:hypothetical protein
MCRSAPCAFWTGGHRRDVFAAGDLVAPRRAAIPALSAVTTAPWRAPSDRLAPTPLAVRGRLWLPPLEAHPARTPALHDGPRLPGSRHSPSQPPADAVTPARKSPQLPAELMMHCIQRITRGIRLYPASSCEPLMKSFFFSIRDSLPVNELLKSRIAQVKEISLSFSAKTSSFREQFRAPRLRPIVG